VATKSQYGTPLTGLPAYLAGLPRAATPRGGVESGFAGEMGSAPDTPVAAEPGEDQTPDFTGMGPWLEADDGEVFRTIDHLVMRQEMLARNHQAQDAYWTYVKLGYPWAVLERPVDNKSVWECTLPSGVSKITPQAVPNQAWNLVNKATEQLLADQPQPDPTPLNDSEKAEQAADFAARFLQQYGGEDGLDTASLAFQALDAALVRCSSYAHYWVDKTGGGYVPLQIEAHPQAQDVEHPKVGPDGMPTTDVVMRYVTEETEDGSRQFTDDPKDAARQWMPRIRVDLWGREHIRVFPETADVSDADKVIGLFYCTLGTAKQRWPETVGQMSDEDLGTLCGWTPVRYLVLLPAQLRARWQIMTGNVSEQQGSGDERIMFYYVGYQRPRPETPEGAAVYVTGAFSGLILEKDTLGMEAIVPTQDGGPTKYERRCMTVPVNQLRPRVDADDRDPSGRAFIELFGGATEFNATLAMSYLEALDTILHIEKYASSTSPVQGFQVDESRATGDAIPVLSMNDRPQYGQTPPIPPGMLDVLGWGQEQVQDISSLSKPLQGADNQQEVSGKSRQIAVAQAQVGLSRMQAAVNSWFTRHYRLMLELAQKYMAAPLLVRFTGEDQSFEVQWFNAEDFALVGDVQIKAGTGTMMTPSAKVNYVLPLLQQGVIGKDAALDLIKPAYSKVLGAPPTPQDLRIERALSVWGKGPPAQWQQQVQQWPQVQAQYQQAVQLAQQRGMQPPPPPQAPFTPFAPRTNDTEPTVAASWMRRCSDVMSGANFTRQPPAWQQLLVDQYTTMRNAVAQMQNPQPGAQAGGQLGTFEQKVYQDVITNIQALLARQTTAQVAGPVLAAPGMPTGGPPPSGATIGQPQ